MSVLKGFLQPSVMDDMKEVIISERFKGEDGKPLPFVIRKIDQGTAEAIRRKCLTQKKVQGQMIERTDTDKYTRLLVLECVASPNFRDAEMCDYYKVVDPAEVPGRMLSVGEYARLNQEILEFNDFDTPEKIEEEAKN